MNAVPCARLCEAHFATTVGVLLSGAKESHTLPAKGKLNENN